MSGNIQAVPQSLINDLGAPSGASVTWTSANTWRSGSTGATATSLNGNLTKGYLDDGGAGAVISLNNLPFLSYNVYVIYGSDQAGLTLVVNGNLDLTGSTLAFSVLGGGATEASYVIATYLNFTFRRTVDSASYDPVVEYGSTLAGWTAAEAGVSGVIVNETNDHFGAGIDRVVVRIPRSLDVGATLFARLKVTIP